MTQQARRRDPYPWTWEVPVGILFTVGLLMTCGVHLGRAGANLIAGAGWQLPAWTALFSSLPGVLGGDPAAGLVEVHGNLASATVLWIWVGVIELLVLTGCVVAVKVGLDRWGPGRMKGMASRTEAEQVLGMSRLLQNRTVIRPDLYESSSNRRWR